MGCAASAECAGPDEPGKEVAPPDRFAAVAADTTTQSVQTADAGDDGPRPGLADTATELPAGAVDTTALAIASAGDDVAADGDDGPEVLDRGVTLAPFSFDVAANGTESAAPLAVFAGVVPDLLATPEPSLAGGGGPHAADDDDDPYGHAWSNRRSPRLRSTPKTSPQPSLSANPSLIMSGATASTATATAGRPTPRSGSSRHGSSRLLRSSAVFSALIDGTPSATLSGGSLASQSQRGFHAASRRRSDPTSPTAPPLPPGYVALQVAHSSTADGDGAWRPQNPFFCAPRAALEPAGADNDF